MMDPNQPTLNIPVPTGRQPISSSHPKTTNKLIFIIGGLMILLVGTLGGYYWWQGQQTLKNKSLTWEECLKIPNARKLLIYPGVCIAPDGRKVTQPLLEEEKKKQQHPDETANWKTYRSTDNSFTFRYPNDWVQQENNVFGSRSVTEFRYQNNPVLEISLIGNYNQVTGQPFRNIEEYVGIRKDKSSNFSLDGHKAKRIIDSGEPGHIVPYEEILVFPTDLKTIISLYFKPDYYPSVKENKTLNQILSTFRFQP